MCFVLLCQVKPHGNTTGSIRIFKLARNKRIRHIPPEISLHAQSVTEGIICRNVNIDFTLTRRNLTVLLINTS